MEIRIERRKMTAEVTSMTRTIKVTVLLVATLGFLTMPLLWSTPLLAQEMELTPTWTDDNVHIDETFKKPEERVPLTRAFKDALKEMPSFFRDTKLDVNLRTYYLDKDKFDNSKNQAWAIGGALTYKSGYAFDRFALGAALYTSQPVGQQLESRDGTLLLEPGQSGYTVLGQAYAEIKVIDGVLIDLYRQAYNTPYINGNDNRMTPNTFEGYSIVGRHGGKDGAPEFTWGGGYVTKIKERNSDKFVWMSEDAGSTAERGVIMGGARYANKGFSIGAINYYSEDIINIFYTESKYTLPLKGPFGLGFSGQFSQQNSTGDNLLKGYNFATNQFGVKGDASYGGGIVTLAYTQTAKGADMQNPWSGYPGYTSVQVEDFNWAGTKAVMTKVGYDFSKVGLQGVTAYALWVHGWGRINPTTHGNAYDEDEYDFDLQWRPKMDWLKGLWFRGRYAYVEQRGGGNPTINDFRIIVNYDFSLL
jgi:hypothetical protein